MSEVKADHYEEDPDLYFAVPCCCCKHRLKKLESPECPCLECKHYTMAHGDTNETNLSGD
jgi:hypothetical protein